MEKFVDRQAEITELNRLLALPSAQLIPVYGRRRVGKTTLLLHWARQAGHPYLYWVARRETADASRHSFARAVWAWAYPEIQNPEPPRFDSWELLFREMARMFAGKPLIVILDEFPMSVHYAFFARAGFTDAARELAESAGAMLVDLARLDTDLLAALNRMK